MPGSEHTVITQRTRCVADASRGVFSLAELCRRYDISRPTGYRWLTRFTTEGPRGLHDRSHRPRSCPHATPPALWTAIREARMHHPTWGPKKLLWLAAKHHSPPLTVVDAYSRYLLACRALLHSMGRLTRPGLEQLFHDYGLPHRIRTDNGAPFAGTALARLSTLAVWWIKLGITPDLIEPGHPEQNPRHERLHRTLKAETTRPPATTCTAQQARFTQWRQLYNDERPHEALHQQPPGTVDRPSSRPFPTRLRAPEYPGHLEVRRVSRNGGIRWQHQRVPVSHTLLEEYMGFEAIDDGLWDVYFYQCRLGRFDERHGRIIDDRGRLFRHAFARCNTSP